MRRVIIEFNEKQQAWHFNSGNSIPNTFGWFTVFECTENEARLFVDIVEAIDKGKITQEWLLKFADNYSISLENYKMMQEL
jgi:hypothetical protein